MTDVGTIEFAGSSITGTSFSGGTPTPTSDRIAGLGGFEDSGLDGAFFGVLIAE